MREMQHGYRLNPTLKVIVAATIWSTAAVGAEPQIGTWVLNGSKSRSNVGAIPKAQIITIWREGDWTVLKVEGRDFTGKVVEPYPTRYKEDGKTYSSDNGTSTIAVTKISDYEYRVLEKTSTSKSWIERHNTYSKDGKMRTSRVTGVNPKGEKIDRLLIFDRR